MFIRFLIFVYDIIKISYSYYQDFIIMFINNIKISLRLFINNIKLS